jgi:hypothetical protein
MILTGVAESPHRARIGRQMPPDGNLHPEDVLLRNLDK